MNPPTRIGGARTRSALLALSALVAGGVVPGAHGARLSEILQRNEMVMCAQADALPYSHQGEPEGFQIELGKALAAELGVALRVHFMHIHREPRKGECDTLISVAVPKDPNAETDYRMSEPYMAYRPVLVVHRSQPTVETLGALAAGRIAVQSGSWAHFLLGERGVPVWVRFRTDEAMIHAVETGEAAAAIVSNFGYDWYVRQHPEAAIRTATELALEDDLGFDVAIGLMSADQALIDRVNVSLARMSKAGIIAAVLARYGIALIPAHGVPDRE